MEGHTNRGRLSGLLPVAVLLLLFLGVGIPFREAVALPPIVPFVLALCVAFLQNPRRPFAEKLESVAHGMGERNVMIMCLVFLLAGAFSGAVTAAGGVESTVNAGLSILPPRVAVAGLFAVGAFVSTAMGTSVGTIAALVPIAVGVAQKAGFPGALCVGAVVCGAMFGDNLSMISDTTIAATRTQGCGMRDKFRENIRLVLPAAVLSLGLFALFAGGEGATLPEELPWRFLRLLPYLAVLTAALAGVNVFLVLTLGTALSLVVGVGTGALAPHAAFEAVGNGIAGMYDITAISLVVAGVLRLVRDNGGLDWLLGHVSRRVRGPKGAQLGIAALGSAMDVATANNTVAIVVAGPVAREVAATHGVPSARAAAVLDIFTSVWQGILPYGAQLLYAAGGATAQGMTLAPTEVLPWLFYPFLMGVTVPVLILLERRRS